MVDEPGRWQRVKQLLQDALEQPADQRGRFLRSSCGDDRELQGEVESLLLAHAAAGSFAQQPAIDALAPSAADALRDGAWAVNRLQRGDRFGHYEILSPIGKGGMGEVWKARDTTLRRDVAVKTLPEEFAQDPDRLARLEREATLLASLNHPNIATIHGLEEHHGTRFLVLELVEGRTLADRLGRGPIPIEESLRLAQQIAEALEAAHDKGVIHRDLKPANIKVTPDGRIKVLDFGLAKALAPASDNASTLRMLTEVGVVMGTPAYMSPEQARGEAASQQSDIWSFGVVFYELLTGASPFGRPTTAETLASVLGTQPNYAALPSNIPASARQLIRRCLEKDQKRRWQHMGDVRIEIEEALAALTAGAPPGPATASGSNARRRWAGGGTALAVLAGVAWWWVADRSTSQIPAAVVRLSIPAVDPLSRLQPFGVRHVAISEDGTRVAYASANRLLIRRMGQKEAVSIEVEALDPFFSPNGEWVGFFGLSGIRKVPAVGGVPVRIVTTSDRPGGATWRADGTIVFATSEGLYQVSESGGAPRLLTKPDPGRKESRYAWPQFMPDGRSVLFTIVPEDAIEGAQIAVLDLKTLEARVVLRGGSAARYASTGHLVYASGQTLKAVAFDATTHQARGDPVSLPDIEVATTSDNGAAEFGVSETGTLLFIAPNVPGRLMMWWIDRQGRKEALPLPPDQYANPRVSPDGKLVALDIPGANRDIWIWNIQRRILTKLTNGPTEDMLPVWSRDGRRVFFASDRSGTFDLYSQAADGATKERLEFSGPGVQFPIAFTPDGTRLLVGEDFKDLSALNLSRPDRLEPLLHNEFANWLVQVSPDGKWMAYESNETGQVEIFVRPFPNASGQREKVSLDGGRFPLWGRTGSGELYYLDLDGHMMAAAVKLSPSLSLGGVTKLFDWQKPRRGPAGMVYDISPVDGRFLMVKGATDGPDGAINISVVLNWFQELRERVPLRAR